MKKLMYLCILVILVFTFVSCSSKTHLQEITNTNKKQSEVIERIFLDELSTKYVSVREADMSRDILEGMEDHYEVYEVLCEDGNTYLLILNENNNKGITAILDESDQLAFGLIDNTVLPKYFENYN